MAKAGRIQALVQERFGPPAHALHLTEIDAPQPGPGEVLVEVRAASVNSWDWDKVTGTAWGRFDAPFGPPRRVLGADVAGTVVSLGTGVDAFRVGDNVFGDLSGGKWGGFAERVAASASALAPIPTGLGFVEAAALPQAGALALQALRSRPELSDRETLLFNGAGGGVGTLALQLAKASGVRTIAVDSADKLAALAALGADETLDYRSSDFTDIADRYDLIIDVVSQHRVSHYTRSLRPGGSMVAVGGTVPSVLSIALFGSLAGKKRAQRLGLLLYRVSSTDFAELGRLVVDGRLTPVIDSVYPLADGAAAVARLGSGRAIGKVVISMDPSALRPPGGS